MVEKEGQKTQSVRLTNEQKQELVHQARERGLLDSLSREDDPYRYTDVRAHLTDRERLVLRHRFPVKGSIKSQAEVGDEFGVTGSDIGLFERRAISKLQYQLSKSSE